MPSDKQYLVKAKLHEIWVVWFLMKGSPTTKCSISGIDLGFINAKTVLSSKHKTLHMCDGAIGLALFSSFFLISCWHPTFLFPFVI